MRLFRHSSPGGVIDCSSLTAWALRVRFPSRASLLKPRLVGRRRLLRPATASVAEVKIWSGIDFRRQRPKSFRFGYLQCFRQIEAGKSASAESTPKGFPAGRVMARPTGGVDGRHSLTGAWFQQTGIAYFAVLPSFPVLANQIRTCSGVTTVLPLRYERDLYVPQENEEQGNYYYRNSSQAEDESRRKNKLMTRWTLGS
jgi:hypothetical protein